MEEKWEKIPGYEGYYEASTLGHIRNSRTGKILKDNCRGSGSVYAAVSLTKGSRKSKKIWNVHVLIALTFLPNPENKPEVDHINRNCRDNRLENLRWTTSSENCMNRDNISLAHNFDSAREEQRRPVIATDVSSGEKTEFPSIAEASRCLSGGTSSSIHCIEVNICACLKGKQKTSRGYRWEYKEEN